MGKEKRSQETWEKMIAYIEGKLTWKDPTFVIIDIGGIGYEIKISLGTFTAIKDLERCKLHTYLHVKEDSHTLFGFFEPIEKKNIFIPYFHNRCGPKHRVNGAFVTFSQ